MGESKSVHDHRVKKHQKTRGGERERDKNMHQSNYREQLLTCSFLVGAGE